MCDGVVNINNFFNLKNFFIIIIFYNYKWIPVRKGGKREFKFLLPKQKPKKKKNYYFIYFYLFIYLFLILFIYLFIYSFIYLFIIIVIIITIFILAMTLGIGESPFSNSLKISIFLGHKEIFGSSNT